MDDKENKNLPEITDDIKNVTKKIVKRVEDENLVNDIKQSFSAVSYTHLTLQTILLV